MIAVPHIPDTAPFSPEQRAWLNGFLAGLFSRAPGNASATAPAAAEAIRPLTILFGSQTGTAEGLARKAAKEAGKRGFAATVVDMAQTDAAKLANEKNLLVIVSTYGDGEPPDSARALHAALGSEAPGSLLEGTRFSVCALGDRTYAQFCRCGADFDSYLEKRGAARIEPRVDCDVDYEEPFAQWLSKSLGALSANAAASPVAPPGSRDPGAPVSIAGSTASGPASDAHDDPRHSKKNPFPAPIVSVRRLSGPASTKEVNHVEISLAGSGLVYEAGDALGVVPQNCPDLVSAVLATLECDGEEAVPAPDGSNTSLRHALVAHYDLGKPGPEFLSHYAAGVGSAHPFGAVGVATTAVAPLHVIDYLHARADLKLPPREFVRTLRRLQPRLYSISSSPKLHPGEAHLTVGAVRYDAHGRTRKGACSTFLAERALGSGQVGVFVHANKAFRPPTGRDAPMIMVGPGTGIAPFRAFLEERCATGDRGKNWLFFGDQREAHDFLYREELHAWRARGTLHRLDLAWSRDQADKVYVQTRMLEAGAELWSWLEAGAHVYVCGDASRMAKDVDAALHRIVETAGGKSKDEAAAYVRALQAAKRYQRDVY